MGRRRFRKTNRGPRPRLRFQRIWVSADRPFGNLGKNLPRTIGHNSTKLNKTYCLLAVHFHRTGTVNDGDPAEILGSAVVDSRGWGFVNHSSYVDMTNNVAVGVNGAAFVTEVCGEIGGFYISLAVGLTGSTDEFEAR